jgi:hypothetical protein
VVSALINNQPAATPRSYSPEWRLEARAKRTLHWPDVAGNDIDSPDEDEQGPLRAACGVPLDRQCVFSALDRVKDFSDLRDDEFLLVKATLMGEIHAVANATLNLAKMWGCLDLNADDPQKRLTPCLPGASHSAVLA